MYGLLDGLRRTTSVRTIAALLASVLTDEKFCLKLGATLKLRTLAIRLTEHHKEKGRPSWRASPQKTKVTRSELSA